MSDRDETNRVPLGDLEEGERYVGCLHFRNDVSFVEAARSWHEVARYASRRFGQRVDIEDAELCREFDFGASVSIYRDSTASVIEGGSGGGAMTAVHPTDAQLGERLLLSRVLFSLACNTVMVADERETHKAVCDAGCCGWHWADIRVVGANFRRFEVPEGNVPDTVWVVSGTSAVPGIIHRKTPEPRKSPE